MELKNVKLAIMKLAILVGTLYLFSINTYAQGNQEQILRTISVWAYWGLDSNRIMTYPELKNSGRATFILKNNIGIEQTLLFDYLFSKKHSEKLKNYDFWKFKPFMIIELSTSSPGVTKTYSRFIDKDGVYFCNRRNSYCQIKDEIFQEVLAITRVTNFYNPKAD